MIDDKFPPLPLSHCRVTSWNNIRIDVNELFDSEKDTGTGDWTVNCKYGSILYTVSQRSKTTLLAAE